VGVDPVSVTLGVVAAPLAAKALERATERAVDAGESSLRRLVDWLRERLRHDEPGNRALELMAQTPDSPSLMQQLAQQIDERAAMDPGFRAELEALVGEIRAEGVDVAAIQQTAWGDRNVQIARVSGSQVNVSYGSPPPDPSA
jgi:hypothetical protein